MLQPRQCHTSIHTEEKAKHASFENENFLLTLIQSKSYTASSGVRMSGQSEQYIKRHTHVGAIPKIEVGAFL